MTVNNLLSDTETREAKDYLLFLEDIAPDAILVQDLGAINLARELDLRIPLHASTMMNVHNAHGASFLARNGITRIVCSRDISIREAADIKKDSGLEVEYFLHNDICISQGSLCYLSGIATEKSSNRGPLRQALPMGLRPGRCEDGKGFSKPVRQILHGEKRTSACITSSPN